MIISTQRSPVHNPGKRLTASEAALGLIWLLSMPVQSAAVTNVFVPAGDTEDLISAMAAANLAPETTVIHLEAGTPYEFNLGQAAPEPITGDIVLLGDGADFAGQGAESFGQLFEIGDEGRLEISDLVIRDFSGDEVSERSLMFNAGTLTLRDVRIERITSRIGPRGPTGSYSGALIVNEGGLDLDRVRVSDITVNASGNTPERIELIVLVLENYGSAGLRNALISDSRALDPGLARPFGVYIQGYYAITDEGLGSVGVEFSTLIGNSADLAAPSEVIAFNRHCLRPSFCASLRSTASMILGLPCPFGQTINSGGFNLVTDDQCSGFQASDQIGVSPGPVKLEADPAGGIRMALAPFSPALDRVSDSQVTCPARDASRFARHTDGNNDGIARCDIGAFENPEGRSVLNGGENGLFYSAGADGHYVSIEEVRPREYVIFWNTFDRNGNQAWVLAVGTRQGDEIIADAFFQPEGVLIPGQGADVNTDALQLWGTVTVIPHDCSSGTFIYDSELNQFGSGAFPLDRLGLTEGIGCMD